VLHEDDNKAASVGIINRVRLPGLIENIVMGEGRRVLGLP
jgi:hypothetical protein